MIKEIRRSFDALNFQPVMRVTVDIPLEPLQDASAFGNETEYLIEVGRYFADELISRLNADRFEFGV